jgi:acetylornithine deacetylase/succinyl-diaminopimelate desuccinylase-like protein
MKMIIRVLANLVHTLKVSMAKMALPWSWMKAVSFLIRMEYRVVNEPYPAGFVRQYGSVVASPGIAEKGFINVLVEVTAPGGHSSIPPAHTVITFFQYTNFLD